MSEVVVVTERTANLPTELIDGYPIQTVPLKGIWDGVGYDDRIDIMSEAFYNRFSQSNTMPTTS